jgi:hypothetical protein
MCLPPSFPLQRNVMMPSFGLSNARAEASRKNGARSRGPKTPDGKARSAQNALKHGMCAQKCVVLPDEDAAEFAALEAALMEELAPEGALQTVLAQRIVAATWRLARAERLETELFAENGLPGGSLGLALIRGHRAGAFDTLVRYRGGALAEFWRALRTLKALQAERAALQAEAAPQVADAIPAGGPARLPALAARPNEPERRGNPGDFTIGVAQRGTDPAPAWPVPAPITPAKAPLAEQGRSGLLARTALAFGRCSGA